MPHAKYSAILVVNPYGIGDMLFTTPLFAALRSNYPDAYIAALAGSRTYDILKYNPDINEVFVFDKGRFDRENKLKGLGIVAGLLKKLKTKKIELLIDLSNAEEYAFLSKFFLRIPVRIGFNYRGRGRFLTDKLELSGFNDKHVVEYYIDIATRMGLDIKEKGLKLIPGDENIKWADDALRDNDINAQDKLIAVIPGGGTSWGEDAAYKHWPAACFAKLADELIEKQNAKIALFGDASESNICAEVIKNMRNRAIDLSGKTTLLQLAAILKRCRMVVANDGGPLHIAVSQRVDTVAIFGPVDPVVYGAYPYSEKHISISAPGLDCRPCYKNFKFTKCIAKECLAKITPEYVLGEIGDI